MKYDYSKTRLNQNILILTVSWILTSCDPMKNVLILNYTGQNVRVTITQDTTNHLSLGSKSQTNFKLAESGDSSSTRYVYGLGVFSKEELKSFKTMIKQIYIETESDTCKIKGVDLNEFLPHKRKRLFKSELEIKIKNCPQQHIL